MSMDHAIGSRDKGRSKPPSLLACLQCRRSHLKCDGQKPLCRRCAEKGSECQWIESRRGYRDYRKQATPPPRERSSKEQQAQHTHHDYLADSTAFSFPINHNADSEATTFAIDGNFSDAHPYTYGQLFGDPYSTSGDLLAYNDASIPFTTFQPPMPTVTDPMSSPGGSTGSSAASTRREIPSSRQDGGAKETVDLIEAFYEYFYPGHPFVIPQKLARQRPDLLPKPLRATMRFLAAHYTPTHNITALQKAAQSVLSDQTTDDVFKVQGLIICAITCLGRYEQAAGAQAVDKAIHLALRIGLNKHAFAIERASSNPILQESFRRTWWSLFVVDGLLTAIGAQSNFRLQNVFCDVPLPCDDKPYNNLYMASSPRSLRQFRNRTFSEDPFPYSSHAYAIEATYIMGAIFNLVSADTQQKHITDPQVEAIDASISNLIFSLPPNKREVLPNPHTNLLDEPLLMAHMIINWASIQLHRPRSTLTFIRNHDNSHHTQHDDYSSMPSCIQDNAASPSAPTSSQSYASHTSKALLAANNLIQLGSLPRSLAYCTPAMMCAITAAATVHLPAYALATNAVVGAGEDGKGDLGLVAATSANNDAASASASSGTSETAALAIRERLQLGISALGRFAEIWPRAKVAKAQVAGFAREVLSSAAMKKKERLADENSNINGNNADGTSSSSETLRPSNTVTSGPLQQQQPHGMNGFGKFLSLAEDGSEEVGGQGQGLGPRVSRNSPSGLDFGAAGLSMSGGGSSTGGVVGGIDGGFLDVDSFAEEAETADWMAFTTGRDLVDGEFGVGMGMGMGMEQQRQQRQWQLNDAIC